MNEKFYNDLLIELDDAKEKIEDILTELEMNEQHKKFEKIFGTSIANENFNWARDNLRKVELCIRNEIRHQREGML